MCGRRCTRIPFNSMKTELESQAIETLLARSAVYGALSTALRRPDADLANWLMRKEYRRLPEIMEHLSSADSLVASTRKMVDAFDHVSLSALSEQHDRIFGHAVESQAPPYELEYGEEHSHRQPQELGDIAAFYQAFGLQVRAAAHERVDHLVTQCEFLQFLLYKQACALDEGETEHAATCEAATRQFLADHLGRWAPAFALRLSRAAGDSILGAVAQVLFEWTLEDCARLHVTTGPKDIPLRLPKEADDASCAGCTLRVVDDNGGRNGTLV